MKASSEGVSEFLRRETGVIEVRREKGEPGTSRFGSVKSTDTWCVGEGVQVCPSGREFSMFALEST